MRTRLVIVFMVPLVGILMLLGGAYAWSVARNVQQSFFTQQLGDISYFVTSARQALRADNPSIVASEAKRYDDVLDTRVVVFDRSGSVWATGSAPTEILDESLTAQVEFALAGRRSELVPPVVLPWQLGESVIVEPVFDDGNTIGAVAVVSSVEVPRGEILRSWAALGMISIAVILLLFLAVSKLAAWVLRPMRRVDRAMEAIERGDMDARIDDDTGPPEMRRMIAVFNRMAGEIERVVARQQEFVMNASHELRNPLGALMLRVEYLATGLDTTWDADVDEAREEGRRMTRILETMLSLARGGGGDSAFAVVDLVALVQERSDAWREVAVQKDVQIASVRHAAEQSEWSVTDRTSVESALDAVIDNAVKFSPEGATIELSVERRGEHRVISVRDHGPGLEEEDVDQVTSRFWRSPRDQNVPGSGLGLAIANDLLTALGGEVRVLAPDDGGLRVELRLPEGDAA